MLALVSFGSFVRLTARRNSPMFVRLQIPSTLKLKHKNHLLSPPLKKTLPLLFMGLLQSFMIYTYFSQSGTDM
jgi:hypothetical protein